MYIEQAMAASHAHTDVLGRQIDCIRHHGADHKSGFVLVDLAVEIETRVEKLKDIACNFQIKTY